MGRRPTAWAIAAGMALGATMADADDTTISVKTLLPTAPGRAACFAGTFDHLPLDSVDWLPPASGDGPRRAVYSAHRVQEFTLELTYARTPAVPDNKDYPGYDRRYDFLLSAKLADRGPLYAAGACGWLGHDFVSADGKLKMEHTTRQLYCGIECDGGGMTLERIESKDSLILRIEANHHLRMTPPCGDEGKSVTFAAREAAKEFNLATAKLALCRPLERWIARKR
jgi:hypothetical protein